VRRLCSLVLILSFAGVTTKLSAQLPIAGGGPAAPAVEMLLAQTGPLHLTDAQVVRLAAIARRAEDRHRALRTRLDSLRPRRALGGPDSTARRTREAFPTDLFECEREASHNDLRDALAVLSPDQQARAWEMAAARRGMGFGPGAMPRIGRSETARRGSFVPAEHRPSSDGPARRPSADTKSAQRHDQRPNTVSDKVARLRILDEARVVNDRARARMVAADVRVRHTPPSMCGDRSTVGRI